MQEIHISADIAVALQQFYATTYKRDWLCTTAWPLLREIATFLQSRVVWQNETQQYHIKSKFEINFPSNKHHNYLLLYLFKMSWVLMKIMRMSTIMYLQM